MNLQTKPDENPWVTLERVREYRRGILADAAVAFLSGHLWAAVAAAGLILCFAAGLAGALG